jgi:hypothetical protein
LERATDDFKNADKGAIIILLNGKREDAEQAVSYVQLHPNILISKVPVFVGWVPYQNLFVNVNILKSEMKEMREHMDEKMEHMDEKMEHMDEKMEHMDEKMEYIAKVVDSLAKVVDSLEKEVDSQKLVGSCICACILLAIVADKVFYK